MFALLLRTSFFQSNTIPVSIKIIDTQNLKLKTIEGGLRLPESVDMILIKDTNQARKSSLYMPSKTLNIVRRIKPLSSAALIMGVALVYSAMTTRVMAEDTSCAIGDRPCIIGQLQETAKDIDNQSWRDQIYREIAKTHAFDGNMDAAIALIEQIKTPDTKAMTIRGIGMAAADKKLAPDSYNDVFTKLRAEAEKITHQPSYAIALTYIAMAQAFAGDDAGAWETASSMKNEALRQKAYAETAEIQAEKGDFEAAMKSLDLIESLSFRNKAYGTVSKILADREKLSEALRAAEKITNAYQKSTALQYILDVQKPRTIPKQ
jgi:predicted negative regulator of RcsB-dependent stress response